MIKYGLFIASKIKVKNAQCCREKGRSTGWQVDKLCTLWFFILITVRYLHLYICISMPMLSQCNVFMVGIRMPGSFEFMAYIRCITITLFSKSTKYITIGAIFMTWTTENSLHANDSFRLYHYIPGIYSEYMAVYRILCYVCSSLHAMGFVLLGRYS